VVKINNKTEYIFKDMRKKVELLIDEDEPISGIEAVSLVRFPAIETDFVYLSSNADKKMSFAMDEEKQMLIGPALIPDKLIMRLDENDEEYDVYFSKDTVRQAMELFMREARTNESTLEHASKIDGVTVVESWLVEDSKKDKSALYGFDLPVGTWMIASKVNNKEIWEKVKKREVRGYSIEGYFTDRLVEMKRGKLCKNCPEDEQIIEELKAIILEEVKPSGELNGQPLFKKAQDAQLWGEIFFNRTGFNSVSVNGETLYSAKQSLESYPWDECIRDQTNRYGSKEVAEKVCGMIRSKYG
tara:strand:+ start:1408 stop:2307 length:900 start_codon:yes stop_codon:yes gene_type:complete